MKQETAHYMGASVAEALRGLEKNFGLGRWEKEVEADLQAWTRGMTEKYWSWRAAGRMEAPGTQPLKTRGVTQLMKEIKELGDRMENAWAARLNQQTERLWGRMENAWATRLNVAAEAIARRVEHLEEGMSTAVSKLCEEITKRGMPPAYQPYTTGPVPWFQRTERSTIPG
ncbi:hypothetical protein BDZ91DRAFT_564568 [Kalaharituber pfeilii]|nr:hypothetical protein BDZ91DRAFT_564568 [Kalaharituber pfeilii]